MNTLDSLLDQLEGAQLIRGMPEEERAYWFRHALIQDSMYSSLLRPDRKRLHRAVGLALERAYAKKLDEYAALLARHFELAEEPAQAFEYLLRAAAWARRSAAHREESAFLARAIVLAERFGPKDRIAELHTRRGKAFASVTLWREAKQELTLALETLPPTETNWRVEALLQLATVSQWLWDMPGVMQHAQAALHLADEAGRDDWAASAMVDLALAEVSAGHTHAGIELYEHAFARAGETRSPALIEGLELTGLAKYWLGEYDSAVERIRTAISFAQESSDTAVITRGLSDLGMAYMGQGEYGQAIRTFEQAREFGREHGVEAFLARCTAMLGGLHLAVFDYAGAEALAEEARELARASKFAATVVSAAIDLLVNYTQRGELVRAQRMLFEADEAMPAVYGSHRWIWEIRLAAARAELALARSAWDQALTAATEAVSRSRATGRVKYQVAGLCSRARALEGLGWKQEAIAELQTALALARQNPDPAMFLRAAITLLAMQGDDSLAREARTAARRISQSLPTQHMRTRFEAIVAERI